ncbi:aldehyde dehydrogenase family protein [Streptomyces sp. NPDC006385]|uniref:aldehyde dehydrogenase family protein n=1 Tax=Streptomyces sp. NPDC006385 TaxID=3156761 RepID=UPI0033A51C3A
MKLDHIFVNGQWTASAGSESIDVLNPYTESVIGRVPEGDPVDVDRAVAAARSAFDSWSRTPVRERLAHLERITAGVRHRSEELAQIITAELGSPITESRRTQVGLSVTGFEGIGEIAADYPFEEAVGNSLVIREPAGVAACITPWNYPLHQITLKVASALAAGCTVVLKPSEVTPLNAFVLAEIIEASGLPAGVFNLVCGPGQTVGEALVSHPEVDLISFTGSTRAGVRISRLAAPKVNKVCLELGGKSASVILDDADLAAVVPDALDRCVSNSGQSCSALTRLLVPQDRLDEAAELAAVAARRYVLGDPADETTELGPLASLTQRDIVRSYIASGIDEGAQLVCGGAEAPAGLPRGYFVAPTVFTQVTPQMTIFREEIFGPVLSITGYRDDDHAVALANAGDYGLSGGVWSADIDRAHAVARRLRTGQVRINGGAYNFFTPFGGYKMSGLGRESGRYGFEEFLEVKSLLR